MATMGKFCKAFYLKRLRAFSGWKENVGSAKKREKIEEGESKEALTDDDYVYLQENYKVTNGIFIDENIIFDSVTPQWIEFCKKELEFEIETIKKEATEQN
jgi:hypothetical protein